MGEPDRQPDPLRVENPMDLLLVLLYARGKSAKDAEPIEGITRLQKLLFLLQQDIGPKQLVKEAEPYQYKPFKMGPYSEQLRRDLEELESAGIVVTERLDYWLPDDGDGVSEKGADFDSPTRETKRVESYRFSLSPDLGQQIGKELWDTLVPKAREELADFKAFFNSLSLRQLLIFTYEKYPQYTEASTIKKQLGLF
ncbi:MAG: hypothetical protein JSU63_01155 [Phycisphaerales bacterium]|nr:MAG: hypothetical protein JSU63_01155 [Phycisphaerales bacterium]